MAPEDSAHRRNNTTPQAIPLQDLSRPPEASQHAAGSTHRRTNSEQSGHLVGPRLSIRSSGLFQQQYSPLEDHGDDDRNVSRSPPSRRARGGAYHGAAMDDEFEDEPLTPIADGAEFQAALGGLGFAGLSFGHEPGAVQMSASSLPQTTHGLENMLGGNDSSWSLSGSDLDDQRNSPPIDADTTPLTDVRNARRFQSSSPSSLYRHKQDKSVQFNVPETPSRRTFLGDELMAAEAGFTVGGGALGRSGSIMRSLSPVSAESPLFKAGTMMRKMSQRVVNLANEPELDASELRRRSAGKRDSDFNELRDSASQTERAIDGADSPTEKSKPVVTETERRRDDAWMLHSNPLKGKSLGIFPPESHIRTGLCNLLVHPFTEPVILVLILFQTILLAIDAGTNVFDVPRTRHFSGWINYTLLGLFIIYSLEIAARIIVSGFLINPLEYSTINRQIGLRKALLAKSSSLFALHPEANVVNGKLLDPGESSILRALTYNPTSLGVKGHGKQQRRVRLAHRAFLRHSFNRVDLLAVVSFWISFVMTLSNYESIHHVYIFRMLSCLRILRLLSLTSGTSVILRSLKKAAPLLLNVALLIGFFWLIFAIIGVQAFKSSLRRTCVWVDPEGNQPNYTQNVVGNFQFCGGQLNSSGHAMPYLLKDGTESSGISKGYLCPPNSYCVSTNNPYSGTVSYDNILQSLELVFVVMTSNTFTDLMYYLTDSDYLAAALFSAAGIVILSFWLLNLLIAVITSSFQIIREESKTSAFADEPYEQPQHESAPRNKRNELRLLFDRTFWFWIVVIAFGLLVQAFRSASMSHGREVFINVSETTVTLILLLEILVRFAVDWRAFFTKRNNLVDLGLAIITTVMQIPVIHNSGQPYAWLTAFQILRSYRVVLAIPWTRNLILLVLGNVTGLFNLILFVFLLTFLVSIFAAQLFRGELPQYDASGNPIRVTFATIYNCFLGMYQVLSSENWTILLYDVTNYDTRYNTAWIGATFFILWCILAFFIVLNMFIAVIQENFDVSEDEKRVQQVKAFLQSKELGQSSNGTLSLSAMFKLGRFGRRQDPLDYGPAMMEQLLKERVVKDFLDTDAEATEASTPQLRMARTTSLMFAPTTFENFSSKVTNWLGLQEENPFYTRIHLSRPDEVGDQNPHKLAKEVLTQTEQRRRAQREYLVRHPNYNVSLFLFKTDNPIRRLCQKIVGPGRGRERIEGSAPAPLVWYGFSAFLYMAIVAMVILACITTPLYQKQYFEKHDYTVKNWFVLTDLGFAVIFTVEALIRVIADGLFWTPHAYFRSSWGLIDGLVLVTLWINVSSSLFNAGAVSRAVGAFKALRALRLLNVSDSARETFHSVIIRGGWKVVSAAFVSLSLLIPFAIYGLNLFNGKMQLCNDNQSGITRLANCVGEYNSTPYNWEVVAPRVVANPYYSFDNFGNALFILFQIVSQEGWVDVMWSAESITGTFTQPQRYASQGNALFFVVFNLLGAVFVLTLFVSVFMRNYTEQTGVAFLTTEQRSWLELRKLLRQVSPSKRPSVKRVRNRWSQWCYKMSIRKTGKWQRFVTAVLLFHLFLLCMEFYPEPAAWEIVRNFLFLGLTIFYVVNIVVRIVGLSWTRFRKSAWDLYSLFAVGGTLIVTVLFILNYTARGNPTVHAVYTQLHKLFLVSMVLLLIPRNNQLDQLFKTAAASLTAIANLLATWFVLFLVYAIALTQAFGLTRFAVNENTNLNFRTVPKALILLFRMSLGEGWNQIMEDFATIVPPYCTDNGNFLQGDCGSPGWARALFISWNILSMYIFVNMFVSLIYESFSYVYQRSSGLSVVSRDEIRRFKQAWAEYDPNGTGFIPVEKFPRLLGELSGVFEMRIYTGDFTVGSLKEDCKKSKRTSSLPIEEQTTEIDIRKLNQRLAELNVDEIRHRRRRLNVFYEEMLNSADPDRGISFTSLLMTLAHYKVINDNKSLRLEEFLRRRARLQRVEDDVRRRIVSNFLDTVYWAREFNRVQNKKNAGRMTTIPQLQVPEIFVDDPDSPVSPVHGRDPFGTRPSLSLQIPASSQGPGASRSSGADVRSATTPGAPTSAWLRHRPHDSFSHASGPPSPRSSVGGDRPTLDIERTDSRVSLQSARSAGGSPFAGSPSGSGGSEPPSPLDSDDGVPQFDNTSGAGGDRWGSWHHLHMSPHPAYSGGSAGGDGAGGGRGGHDRSRAGSSVSARDVLDVLDNSAWGESLRRSASSAQRGQSPGHSPRHGHSLSLSPRHGHGHGHSQSHSQGPSQGQGSGQGLGLSPGLGQGEGQARDQGQGQEYGYGPGHGNRGGSGSTTGHASNTSRDGRL